MGYLGNSRNFESCVAHADAFTYSWTLVPLIGPLYTAQQDPICPLKSKIEALDFLLCLCIPCLLCIAIPKHFVLLGLYCLPLALNIKDASFFRAFPIANNEAFGAFKTYNR